MRKRRGHKGRQPFKEKNSSLQEANPELAKQWHPTKNGDLLPSQVPVNSSRKVWWYLPYDVPDDYPVEKLRGKHFDFEWEARVGNRTRYAGCPYLSGQAVWPGFNDLGTINPELAKQWHPTKNGDLLPSQVYANSTRKVWWYLAYDVPEDYPVEKLRGKHFDFEWEATVQHRNSGTNCPYLTGNAVWPGFNDLKAVNPELAQEWHPTKNGDLLPSQVPANSPRKVWWYLSYDVPEDYPVEKLGGKHFDFEWEARVGDRNGGANCPYLTGNAVWPGFNDLRAVNPELALQWHPVKNGDLLPSQVPANSSQKVWWYLPYDVPEDYPVEKLRGKHFDFEWEARVITRNKGGACPFLSGRELWSGFNDLETLKPELAKQWHPAKNGDLLPSQVLANSSRKVWWYLPYDVPEDYPVEKLRGKHFDFEWETGVKNRISKGANPFLAGQAFWKGFNDLETVKPELAKQWHPAKNGDLLPSQVYANSSRKVWWYLSYDVPEDYPVEKLRGKHFDFEWEAQIHNRRRDAGCPYLTGNAVWKGFNDLETVKPELAKQWHPAKNGDLLPSQVPANSTRKVWWLLPYDDPETGKHFIFEWKALISNRFRGAECPFIVERKVWKGFNDLKTRELDICDEWNFERNRLGPEEYSKRSNKRVWWKCRFGHEWRATINKRVCGRGCPICSKE